MSRYKGFDEEQHKKTAEKLEEVKRLWTEVTKDVFLFYGPSSRPGKVVDRHMRLQAGPKDVMDLLRALENKFHEEKGEYARSPYQPFG